VAVHINAFNFPVWGLLEKFAPSFLAGMPCIGKPATATSYLTEAAVRIMLDSGLLPPGALQLVIGGTGELLDRLDDPFQRRGRFAQLCHPGRRREPR
jgi:oxepin-CoA hydrolase/3-oxo-5,6-dehydrosuberyl-CoA semialdehyde dehydrogenase